MDQPSHLGPFELLKKLASGQVLETYLARPSSANTPGNELVVRHLHPQVARRGDLVELFRNAVARVGQLEHPKLAQIFGFSEVDEGQYIVIGEYVWGEDLRRIAERGMTVGRFLPIDLAVRIATDVADAISFVHGQATQDGSAGLVHGSVSPETVVVGFQGAPKLVDLEIASTVRKAAESLRSTRPRRHLAYMSPEQIEGADIDHRSDIFSLGVTLYELTTRKRLFKGTDDVSTRKLVAEAVVKAPSESVPSYPPSLERIVLKALAKDPSDRFQSALELRDELQAFLDTEGSSAGPGPVIKYMRGIFPDKLKELESLAGAGYSGPNSDVRELVEAVTSAAPDESAGRQQPTQPTLPPIPSKLVKGVPSARDTVPTPPALSSIEGWSVPGSVDDATDEAETEPDDGSTELAETPTEPPQASESPAAPIEEELPEPRPTARSAASDRVDADVKVQMAEHTLRKDHPDAFEQAAESSRRTMQIFTILFVIGGAVLLWYAIWGFEWPWEGTTSTPVETPDATARPQLSTPTTIPVEIRSEPAGAAVATNTVIAAQRTPATYELVPGAPNTIMFFMDGYETAVLDVQIGSSPPPDGLSVTLAEIVEPPDWVPPEPDPESDMPPVTEWSLPMGRFNVTTQPLGATVLLNGRDVCRSPCEFPAPAEQEQHITARLAGHLDTVTTAVAPTWDAENDTRYVNLILRQPPERGQIYSYFQIGSTPRGATVSINGELLGRTELNVPRRIEALQRVELAAEGYEPWARSFYPSPGRFQIGPIMDRIRHDPARLTLLIDTPGFETTSIYLGPNEIGVGSVEAFQIDGGTYDLTLSYYPPVETGGSRQRTRLEIALPPGYQVTEHYVWDGSDFVQSERTEEPLPSLEN